MKKLFSPWWLLLLAVAGAAALALVYANVWSLPLHGNGDKLGQMGDFFGGLLNPLVSLLTLFVAISVWQLQREELKLTRDELEQSRLAMEDQAKTAEQQRQEQRFFDLLNVYQQTLGSVVLIARMSATSDVPVHYGGKEAIAHFLRSEGAIWSNFDTRGATDPLDTFYDTHRRQDSRNELCPKWNTDAIRALFDHYFRVVFRILLEANNLLGDQDERYIKLFRAQLSRAELTILACNLWLDEEGNKMVPLAEKYQLLEHLHRGYLRNALEQELPPLVFGRTRAAELATAAPASSQGDVP
ncbi:putative phage abortive infection protein [Hydrogenophaga soli]